MSVVMFSGELHGQDHQEHRPNPVQGRYVKKAIDRAIPLLRLSEVRDELRITDEQLKALRESEVRNPEPRSGRSAGEDGSDPVQSWALTARDHLEEVLHPAQMKRLLEISIQLQGLSALQDRDVARELDITDDQREAIVDRQMSFLIRLSGSQFARTSKQMDPKDADRFREELEVHVLTALDQEQLAKFEKMKGEPFDIPDRWRKDIQSFRKALRQPSGAGNR